MGITFIICAVFAVCGIIGAFLNMASVANENANFTGLWKRHVYCGLCYVFGGFGALISGILWLIHKYAEPVTKAAESAIIN